MRTAFARLVPTAEPDNRGIREVVLRPGRTSFGRSPRNDVRLDDSTISKEHAEILATERGYVLRDLGSKNGTFVNGAPVSERVLAANDLIKLGTYRFRFEPPGTPEEQRSMVTFSADLGEHTQVLAISRMDLPAPGSEIPREDTLRDRYDRVRTAFEAVRSLIETTDIPTLCHRILDVAFGLVPADTGAVLLYDEKGELVPRVSRGRRPEDQPEILISRTIVRRVLDDRTAVLASDAMTDARWSEAESIVHLGVRSLMYVPLLNADRVYGLLHVGNATQVGAFSHGDLELLSGIGSGAGVALSNAFMARRLAEEARARESLGRFLSPVLLEQVMANTVDLKGSGEERLVTVMFADIRGFTALTENSRATAVVSLLNEYFDQMVEIVFRHAGTLDKYIGDALMAVWGNPLPAGDDPTRALAAARDMLSTLRGLNALRRHRGEDAISVGIGLATGPCVAGAIGARRRLDFTVIGDAVNLASRLASSAHAGHVLCDEPTFIGGGRPADAQALPPREVRGKLLPVAVYVLGS